MATAGDREDVRPALERAEAALARHLEEACEDYDRDRIGEESTDELLRLEEELLAAARAADEAVRLRRRMGEGQPHEPERQVSQANTEPAAGDAPGAGSEGSGGDARAMRMREFRTASGSEWRVWEVRPGAGGRAGKLHLYPAEYVQGWLAFELLEGEGRKRLPKFAADWCNCADTDLEQLLQQAVEVPKRKRAREVDDVEGDRRDEGNRPGAGEAPSP